MAFSDTFHEEPNFTPISDDATNCPEGAYVLYPKITPLLDPI